MPFSDFTPLANGTGQFDFKHLKDWTFVDPKPLDQPFVFSNMILVGGPPGCNGSLVTPSATTGSGAQPTSQASASQTSVTETQSTSTQKPSLSNAKRFDAMALNFWLVLLGFLA